MRLIVFLVTMGDRLSNTRSKEKAAQWRLPICELEIICYSGGQSFKVQELAG